MVKLCPYQSDRGPAYQSALALIHLPTFTVSPAQPKSESSKEIRYWTSVS